MKKISLYSLLLAALFFSACTGEVKGHVFLDKNNNSALDADEKGIGKALYEVDRDGELFTSGMTDENGMFFFKKKDKGDYCVKIVNTSDQYITTAPQLTKEPVAGKAAEKAETDTSTTTGTTDTGTTTSEETKKKEEEKKKEPAKPLPAPASLKNCVRLTGYSDKATVNVPVGLDLAASIARIPKQGEITVAAGSEFDLRIYYPYRCTLTDISLPSELSVVGDNTGLVGSGNVLSFSTVKPEKTEAIIPKSLTEMAIVPVIVKLKASEDILESEQELSINPSVECPDGNITTLEAIKIKVMKEKKLSIFQSVGDAILGKTENKTLTIVTEIRNKGQFDFNNDAVLTISLPPEGSNVTVDADNKDKCWTSTTQIKCDVTHIDKDGTFSMTATLKLPKKEEYKEKDPEGFSINIKACLNFYEEAKSSEDAKCSFENIIPTFNTKPESD